MKERRPARAPARAATPSSVDAYLETVPEPARTTLGKLRAQIRAAAPGATELVSYRVPSFRLGRMLVGFAAASGHCTFFLMSTTVMESFRRELAGYETGKGSIRFPHDRPLPAPLVRRLVKARIAENAALDRRR